MHRAIRQLGACLAAYADCLTIQNAARLQYPATLNAEGNQQHATARARFLLNEFPPRDEAEDEEEPEPVPTP